MKSTMAAAPGESPRLVRANGGGNWILEFLMRHWLGVTFVGAVLGVSADAGAAQPPPVPDNPREAQTSLGYSPKKFCPDLRIADEGTNAVVVFWLPSSGIPSRVSIKSSSGSSALDSAAMSCVSKLRFAPATRIGDGESFDSWQQFALRWVDGSHADETRGASQTSAPATGGLAATGVSAPMAADVRQNNAGAQDNSVTVHICVDDTGKLKQDPTV